MSQETYMKPIRSALLFLLVMSPLLQAAPPPAPNVRLTLTLAPATTLPGIPVTVRILVTNDSTSRVELPRDIVLLATTEDGETFSVGSQPYPQVAVSLLGETFVRPRGSTLLQVEVEGAAIQPFSWFDDPRLNMPGRFRLQAAIGTFPGEFPVVPESAIRSNIDTLDVVTPEGVDFAIWKEMLAIGKGRWSPGQIVSTAREFARRVVVEMPESAYAGWFATSAPWQPARESAALLRNWLAQAPPDEFTEWREFRLALLEEHAARQWTSIPRDQVHAHIQRARSLLLKLKGSKNAKIARAATERMDFNADLDELLEK
jgi:hypothetical protein